MTQPTVDSDDLFVPRELPLTDGLLSYVAVLAQRAPGQIHFRTGAGRIFRDLLIHWPALDEWEDEAQELCQRIADAVYPLTGALFAQAVDIEVAISATPSAPPTHIDALSTCVIFDSANRVERRCFLSPQRPLPPLENLTAARGIVVMCRPLNYRYHTIKDDRQRRAHIRAGLFELLERQVKELLDAPPFIAPEKALVARIKNDIKALPQNIERAENTRDSTLSLQSPRVKPAPATLLSVTSLSALPPPVRALEHRLMAYVTNKNLSPELRLTLRQVAQNLRALFPQTLIEEAARRETAPPVITLARPVAQPTASPSAPRPSSPAVTPSAHPFVQSAATPPPPRVEAHPTAQSRAAPATPVISTIAARPAVAPLITPRPVIPLASIPAPSVSPPPGGSGSVNRPTPAAPPSSPQTPVSRVTYRAEPVSALPQQAAAPAPASPTPSTRPGAAPPREIRSAPDAVRIRNPTTNPQPRPSTEPSRRLFTNAEARPQHTYRPLENSRPTLRQERIMPARDLRPPSPSLAIAHPPQSPTAQLMRKAALAIETRKPPPATKITVPMLKPLAWIFPTPTPTPKPHVPATKTRR